MIASKMSYGVEPGSASCVGGANEKAEFTGGVFPHRRWERIVKAGPGLSFDVGEGIRETAVRLRFANYHVSASSTIRA